MAARVQLVPWRSVVTPTQDGAAAFTADLAHVLAGAAHPAYADAEAFFARCVITPALAEVLSSVERRLDRTGGEPVVRLRAGFGGGKTHALLALHHHVRARVSGTRVAVLSGTDLGAGAAWPSPLLGGRLVRTLWGELAAQLGGAQAYEALATEDESAAPPGALALQQLLNRCAPALVLVDEPVVFLRALHGARGMSAGSFDGNLTFLHNLSVAVARCPRCALAVTLPAHLDELGGEGGRAAADGVESVFGRLGGASQPLSSGDWLRIARRRLFGPIEDVRAHEATCRAFEEMYQSDPGGFPPECGSADFAAALREGYPLHPGLVALFAERWARVPGFQGLRGALRVLAAAATSADPAAPVLMAGDVPLQHPEIGGALAASLGDGWADIVAGDLNAHYGADGEELTRAGRATFLASAAGGHSVESSMVRLLAARPGDAPAAYADACALLPRRMRFAHLSGTGVRFERRPNLAARVAERAASLAPDRITDAVHAAVAAMARVGARAAALPVRPVQSARGGESRVPDTPGARWVVLPPSTPYDAADTHSPAIAYAEWLVRACPRHPNQLLFLGCDAAAAVSLRDSLRWQVASEDIANAGAFAGIDEARACAALAAEAGEVAGRRLRSAYAWVIVPAQDAGGARRWDALNTPGDDDPVVRATQAAVANGWIHLRWAAEELALELDRWFWRDGPSVAVGTVWRHLTRYAYLPRLRDRSVFRQAVADGVARGLFAVAATQDGGGGPGRPRAGASGRLDDGHLLVRPTAELPPVAADYAPPADAPSPSGFRAEGAFHGDPAMVGAQLRAAADEIASPLARIQDAELTVELSIEARAPSGLPDHTARTLRENADVLGLREATRKADGRGVEAADAG